jgi:alpha-tubulin suppressor-like RCC1 family protein
MSAENIPSRKSVWKMRWQSQVTVRALDDRHPTGLAVGQAARLVRCWGANSEGQRGDGDTSDRFIPPTTDLLAGVSAIAAGAIHTCALRSNGTVRCWGYNQSGSLGSGYHPPTPELDLCP